MSRDEDSCASLVVTGHTGKAMHVYAGVNSSPEDIDKGKNDHLRSVTIKGTGADTKLQVDARHPLFVNSAGDVYQRLLRFSGTLGAAGSGFGKDPQIALFDVPKSKGSSLVRRGTIELPQDAQDLDVLQLADGTHLLTYCFKHELYLVKVGKTQEDPQLIYTIPADEPNRPSFRFARFIGSEFLVTVANMPARSGIAIQGFRLPKAGQEKARLAVSAKIPRKINATAFSVGSLAAPAAGAGAPIGDAQFVLAIAGNDSSISLFSLEHVASPAINLLTKLHPLDTLLRVHGEGNITGLSFSTYRPPSGKAAASSGAQYLKLVSISLQKKVALHSIPLKKFIDTTPRNKNAPPRPVRYVTERAPQGPSSARTAIILFSIVVLIVAAAGQVIFDRLGSHYSILRPREILFGPASLTTPVVQPVVQHPAEPVIPEVDTASILKDDFLAKIAGEGQDPSETLVLYAETPAAVAAEGEQDSTTIKVEVHDEEVHGPGKTWDELPESQQHAWKARLRDAGAWTQQMGENVFKGILFGELGGAIGHAVAG